MTDKNSPRFKIWMHNGLLGHVRRAEIAMFQIMKASTTTPRTKRTAFEISRRLTTLKGQLKTRNPR